MHPNSEQQKLLYMWAASAESITCPVPFCLILQPASGQFEQGFRTWVGQLDSDPLVQLEHHSTTGVKRHGQPHQKWHGVCIYIYIVIYKKRERESSTTIECMSCWIVLLSIPILRPTRVHYMTCWTCSRPFNTPAFWFATHSRQRVRPGNGETAGCGGGRGRGACRPCHWQHDLSWVMQGAWFTYPSSVYEKQRSATWSIAPVW